MRVTCPHCQKTVSLDDKSAELAVPCPLCGNIFTAPSLMNALPDEPKPVPAPTPPPAVAAPTPPVATAPARSDSTPPQTAPAGGFRFVIKKNVIRWLGPAGLLILFFLSFFNWVGAYPAGYPVYTQSAWQIMTGGFTTDLAADEVFARESQLSGTSSGSFSIGFVLIILIFAAILAAADLAEEYITFAVPDVVQKVWPHRLTVLSIISIVFFGLLSARCIFGLGIETAVGPMADTMVTTPQLDANAPPESAKAKAKREFKRAEEIARLGIRRTWGWRIAYSAAALALIGYGLEVILNRRGRRPEPVVELRW